MVTCQKNSHLAHIKLLEDKFSKKSQSLVSFVQRLKKYTLSKSVPVELLRAGNIQYSILQIKEL